MPLVRPEVLPRPDLGRDVWEIRLEGRSGFVTRGPLRVEDDGTIVVVHQRCVVGVVTLEVGDQLPT